jgi:hypothetical protein
MKTRATAAEQVPMNAMDEHLNEVDVHLTTNDDGAAIEIAAVTSYMGGSGLIREVGRTLLKLETEPTGSPDVDDWYSSAQLDAAIESWEVTPRIEGLMRYLVAEGLKMIAACE